MSYLRFESDTQWLRAQPSSWAKSDSPVAHFLIWGTGRDKTCSARTSEGWWNSLIQPPRTSLVSLRSAYALFSSSFHHGLDHLTTCWAGTNLTAACSRYL